MEMMMTIVKAVILKIIERCLTMNVFVKMGIMRMVMFASYVMKLGNSLIF